MRYLVEVESPEDLETVKMVVRVALHNRPVDLVDVYPQPQHLAPTEMAEEVAAIHRGQPTHHIRSVVCTVCARETWSTWRDGRCSRCAGKP